MKHVLYFWIFLKHLKLKCDGKSGSLLKSFENYLSYRHRCVVLNDKESNGMNLKAGVPQGSALDHLLFFVYLNDLTDNISCDLHLTYLRVSKELTKLAKSWVTNLEAIT